MRLPFPPEAALALMLAAALAPAPAAGQANVPPPAIVFAITPQGPCSSDAITLVATTPCAPCVRIVSFQATDSANAVLVAQSASPRRCSSLGCTVDSMGARLGRLAPGHHVVSVTIDVRPAADSTGGDTSAVVQHQSIAFDVESACPSSPLPFVTQVQIGAPACANCPPVVCANRAIPVTVSGEVVDGCWEFLGARADTNLDAQAGLYPDVLLTFEHQLNVPCPDIVRPFTATVQLPGLPSGPASIDVVEIHTNDADSTTQSYRKSFAFTVPESCGAVQPPPAPSCLWPFLQPVAPGADTAARCDLVLPPGGHGAAPFAVRGSDRPLSGLQGTISAGARLTVLGVDAIGPAADMHLLTQPAPEGLNFVLYADRGAPIPAGGLTPILSVRVQADSGATAGDPIPVSVTVTAGSDSLGQSLPHCPIAAIPTPAAQVCIATPGSCDANHDGVVNVADLVRMVRCHFEPATCPDSGKALPDCNGDGVFTLDDVLCCARMILGGPHAGTSHAATQLQFSLGAPTIVNGLVRVPIEVTGATEMSGALLHVSFPSDRFTAVAGPAGTPAAAGAWLPLVEPGVNDAVVGVLRLDDDAPSTAEAELWLQPVPGRSPGGTLSLDQSSVIAPDGSDLTVNLSQATLDLGSIGQGRPARIELLAAPNPSAGSTRFIVRLPQAGNVDLAIFDLAGRRVAGLWHGPMVAGEQSVSWNGAGVRSGLYFARLSVDGVVRTSRVTLQVGR
ncbi:MAG TPA: T9SS type A sorting domain-containing protein [Candidatus Acidoferrales bacterium]|nr:T9SS type A sorting domain-containing protein [Candidatus Acidoferrales bacterium]